MDRPKIYVRERSIKIKIGDEVLVLEGEFYLDEVSYWEEGTSAMFTIKEREFIIEDEE